MTTSIHAWAAFGEENILAPFTYTPRPLQPLDIFIQITHCGVCHSDVHCVDGDWIPKGQQLRPVVPGHEIIGLVIQRGSAVDSGKFPLGIRVGVGPMVGSCGECDDCQRQEQQFCTGIVDCYQGVHPPSGERTFGGFARGIVVDSRFSYAVPSSLSSEKAAPLLCAGLTVWSPLRRWACGGDVVGIVGIGGLGHLAVQFAHKLGMKVVAFSTSDDKKEQAMQLGADAVVNSSKSHEMQEARYTIDLLLVTSSANLPWSKYLNLLKTGGKLCLLGVPPGKMQIPPFSLLRNVSICGSLLGSPNETEAMLAFAAAHKVEAMVESLPMEKCNEALERVRKNIPRYRCVLYNDSQSSL